VRLALVLLCAGCIGSVTPAQCAVDEECGAAAVCAAGACIPGAREADGGVCPTLHASWNEINQHLVQVGCGVRSGNCHSAEGATASSGLELAGDAYGRLVNHPSADGGFTLVKPGDPESSYFFVKLSLRKSIDPVLGCGMPPDNPGQTCPSAQDAVRQWILAGAQKN